MDLIGQVWLALILGQGLAGWASIFLWVRPAIEDFVLAMGETGVPIFFRGRQIYVSFPSIRNRLIYRPSWQIQGDPGVERLRRRANRRLKISLLVFFGAAPELLVGDLLWRLAKGAGAPT